MVCKRTIKRQFVCFHASIFAFQAVGSADVYQVYDFCGFYGFGPDDPRTIAAHEVALRCIDRGGFSGLVDHLYQEDKLEAVLSSHVNTCSILLKRAAREKVFFMHTLRGKLEYLKL